jgi:hypothetical protein
MKTAFLLTLGVALAAAATPALPQAEGLTNRTVFRSGNWYVVRSTQSATGVVACTGYYMGQDALRLDKESLTVNVPGELKTITLRFDDQAPRPARPPERIEQQMGGAVLSGAEFEQLQRSRTLALEVATSRERVSHTVPLEGLNAALKNIEDGCPLTEAAVRAERAARQARDKAQAARCTPAGVRRMLERGVPEHRIQAECPKAKLPAR